MLASVVTELSPLQLVLYLGSAVSIPTAIQWFFRWLERRQDGQNRQTEVQAKQTEAWRDTTNKLFVEIGRANEKADAAAKEAREANKKVDELLTERHVLMKVIYYLKETLHRVRVRAGFSSEQADEAARQDDAEIAKLAGEK